MSDQQQLVPTEYEAGKMKEAIAHAGGSSPNGWAVPVESLHYDPADNVRAIDPAHVRSLANVMKANGYDATQPLGCVARKVDDEHRLYVVFGQHRYHAALLATSEGCDLGHIPVSVVPSKKATRKNLRIRGINTNKSKDMSPLDLGIQIAAFREEDGMTNAEICEALDITDQTIRDTALLLTAPLPVRELVRAERISSTAVIKEIRAHGAEKAAEIIIAAAMEAPEKKVTGKTLKQQAAKQAKPKEITPAQAKQLCRALQAVKHDPMFNRLSIRAIDAVHAALHPVQDLLDFVDFVKVPTIAVANDRGIFVDNIEHVSRKFPSGGEAEIRLAYLGDEGWVTGYSYMVGSGGASGGPTNSNRSKRYESRERAIIGQADEITRMICKSPSSKHREATKVIQWLADVRERALVGAI